MNADLTAHSGCAATAPTPGPWSVVPDERTYNNGYMDLVDVQGYDIVAENGYSVVGSEGISTSDEDYANARLIAAAPDLLAALQTLLDAVNGHRVTVGDCNEARAAIAKATEAA
jgi:hypothetical protein